MSNLKSKNLLSDRNTRNCPKFTKHKKHHKTKACQSKTINANTSKQHKPFKQVKSIKSQKNIKSKPLNFLKVTGNSRSSRTSNTKTKSEQSNDYKQRSANILIPGQKSSEKPYKGSLIDQLICNQYGYSNISYMKFSSLKKAQSQLLKIKSKKPQRRTIQDIIKKYTQIQPESQNQEQGKDQQFRTLSTDDKSRGLSNKRFSNIEQNLKETVLKRKNRLSLQIKKRKKTPSLSKQKHIKRKKSNKLPEYFGCLSINKVQSKLLTSKDKNQDYKKSKDKNLRKLKQDNTKNIDKQKQIQKIVKNAKIQSKQLKNHLKTKSKEKIMNCQQSSMHHQKNSNNFLKQKQTSYHNFNQKQAKGATKIKKIKSVRK